MSEYSSNNPEFEESNFVFDDEVFERELDDPYSEGALEVFVLNRNASDDRRPVVIGNGLGITPHDKMGRYQLKEYAKSLERKIITFASADVTYGEDCRLNAAELVHEYLTKLDILDVEKMDLVGTSIGGVMMGKLAVAAQWRAENLVMMSPVGTQAKISEYRAGIRHEAYNLLHDMHRMRSSDMYEAGPSSLMTPNRLRVNWAFARIALEQPLFELPHNLSPKTRWTTIAGTDDKLAPVEHHRHIKRERDKITPGMTHLVELNRGHTWAPWDRRLHNELVVRALDDGT